MNWKKSISVTTKEFLFRASMEIVIPRLNSLLNRVEEKLEKEIKDNGQV